MEVQIKKYLKSDRIACLNAFKSNVPMYFTNKEVLEFDAFLSKLESDNFNTQFYVINLNNRIIGCGGFGDKNNDGIISLAWGLIHKDFHKLGFGEKLLAYRIEQIKQLYSESPVIVDTTQYAYGFFEKFGFKTTEITNDYYEIGMHIYNMILEI
jgi:ribosomal-protein-alanine N-acetyltransferase